MTADAAAERAEKLVMLYYGDQVKEMGLEWVKRRSGFQVMVQDIAQALQAARAEALEEAADIVWLNRWEPPYGRELSMVEEIRALAQPAERKPGGRDEK